jgi:hypothetical protein
MNIYFLFQKYLDKKSDYDFTEIWEKRFLKGMRTIIMVLLVTYIILVFGSGILIDHYIGFLSAILTMGMIGIILAYYMVVHFIKFLAINNERYFRIKMGQHSNTINYDNVVN